MKTTLRWTLNVGFVLTIGLTGLSHTAAAASSETSLPITIHVHNYAGVAPKTLTDTEEVATEIFRKAGVETRWIDIVLATENNQVSSTYYPALTSADIQLSILPRVMSDRLRLANNVIGLAPDTDAQIVYVFEGKIETVFWRLLRAQHNGRMERPVSRAQILGHVIAHELGHLLLNLKGHSAHGIMRGELDFTDLHDALLFTPQQAEILRADVRRRNTLGDPKVSRHDRDEPEGRKERSAIRTRRASLPTPTSWYCLGPASCFLGGLLRGQLGKRAGG